MALQIETDSRRDLAEIVPLRPGLGKLSEPTSYDAYAASYQEARKQLLAKGPIISYPEDRAWTPAMNPLESHNEGIFEGTGNARIENSEAGRENLPHTGDIFSLATHM